MIDVCISGNEKKYPIIFDRCEISEIKSKLEEFLNGKKFVVVISKKVYSLYGKDLGFDKKGLFILNDGEKEKNFKNYKKILDFCSKKNLSRDCSIIAIGGGVVGDIAGFVASTYMRGVNLIQVPTTLLACVDSSVGGKVAINSDYGKNLIGNFYQPKVVFINPKFLKTLNLKELKSGLGEIIKYGFIEKSCPIDEEFNIINLLNDNYKQILNYDTKILLRLIEHCVKLKVSVVEKDEKDCGLRHILNFGHTYGHAIEKITNFKKFTHGECVVEGIKFAFDIALKNNLIGNDYLFVMQDLIKRFEYNKLPQFDIRKLLPVMKTDKKASNGNINLVLPVGYMLVKTFPLNDILTIS